MKQKILEQAEDFTAVILYTDTDKEQAVNVSADDKYHRVDDATGKSATSTTSPSSKQMWRQYRI